MKEAIGGTTLSDGTDAPQSTVLMDTTESESSKVGVGAWSYEVSLPRPIPHSLTLIPVDASTLPETSHHTVEQRLLPGCTINYKALIDSPRDITIRARDGGGIETKSMALRTMSAYFQRVFRLNWEEVAQREFRTSLNYATIHGIVGFFESGGILLRMQNIQQMFIASHYLQIPCLIERCMEYLSDNLPETAIICLHLASQYGGLEELAKRAAIKCAENLSDLKASIMRLQARHFAFVISQDALKVVNEDEVCNLIISWSGRRIRSEKEILEVLRKVRIPHLSHDGFKRLLGTFDEAYELEAVQLCIDNRFSELPEEQLTRRIHYLDHLHLTWSETGTEPEKIFPVPKTATELKITCLRCTPGHMQTHKVLDIIPDLKSGNYEFKLVCVMNTLHFVTHSAALKDINIFRREQDSNRWTLSNQIPRVSMIEEFGVCAFRGKIILTMFAGYTELIRVIEVDTFKSGNVHRIIEFPHPQSPLSVPQMSVYDDWLIFLRCDRVNLSNPHKEDFREVHARKRNSRRGIEALAQFKSFARLGKYLYVYKDMVAPSAVFRRVRGLYDKVLKVHIDSQNVENILEVRKPLYVEFEVPSRMQKYGDKRVRKVFVSSSKLFVALQESDNDLCRILHLNPDEKELSHLIDISCTDSQITYTRRLEGVVPIHIHDCGYSTLLSRFCSSLDRPEHHALLERLSRYL